MYEDEKFQVYLKEFGRQVGLDPQLAYLTLLAFAKKNGLSPEESQAFEEFLRLYPEALLLQLQCLDSSEKDALVDGGISCVAGLAPLFLGYIRGFWAISYSPQDVWSCLSSAVGRQEMSLGV